MSTHPNTILLCVLKPDGLSRATFRALIDDGNEDDPVVTIGSNEYRVRVMEDGYDESYQISAAEGDILVFDMVTYGYGERVEWDKLVKQKAELQTWADNVCARLNCTSTFFVTANYW